MFLTPEELTDLTHKARPSAQIRALKLMNIPITRIRPDGTPVVLKEVVSGERVKPERVPNFAALK